MEHVKTSALVHRFGHDLELAWLEEARFDNVLHTEGKEQSSAEVIGHMNCIHPATIQVLGREEIGYLHKLSKKTYEEILQQLTSSKSSALVVADGETVPADVLDFAKSRGMDVLTSPRSSADIINLLRYRLQDIITDKIVVHGVFMEVVGIGVLLCGNSGIGKSELALELLSRGHRLIADDAPQFACTGPNTISGTCPATIQDFIEVRGLGILNVRAMFGDSAIKRKKEMRLIVRLVELEGRQLSELERIDQSSAYEEVLGVKVPLVTVPVAAGRNIAVIVETAARNQILLNKGYNAANAFMRQQRAIMESQSK